MDNDRNPAWIADWLRKDNGNLTVWSARIEFKSTDEATASVGGFRAAGATKAGPDGASSQIVIEFAPTSVESLAASIAASGGSLCQRNPRVPRFPNRA